MRRTTLATPLLALGLLGFGPVASATPVLWTLTDVLFDDNSTAAGSFIYDADTDTYSSIAITTDAGSYGALLAGGATDAAFVASLPADLTGAPLLQFIYQGSLTNAGGIIGLADYSFPANSSFEASCDDSNCFSAFLGRTIVDGGLLGAVVPVPAAGVLLPGALALLGLVRRRGIRPA